MSKPNPQKQVDEFNAKYKVGDEISYYEVHGEPTFVKYKLASPAEVLSGHTAVVWLEGKRGCVACSNCGPA